MRTDVKIGIAVGFVLFVGAVLYMVISPGSPEAPDADQPGGPHASSGDGAGDAGKGLDSSSSDTSMDTSLFGPKPTDPWAPGVGTGGDTARTGAGDTAAGAGTDTGIGVPASTATAGTGTAGTDAATAVPEPDPGSVEITMVPSGPIDPGSAATSWTPSVRDSSTGPIDPATPRDVPYPEPAGGSTAVAGASVVGAVRTHVIRSNDKLWTLAETYYGHGKHWQLLVSANPGLSPTALVVGRTIKIPPLPAQAGAAVGATGSAGAATGTITQAADGTKTYIVAKDDSFWKIAARSDIYGNGIHYKLIAAANPGADSNSLQPGDKLVIPPLATSSTTGGTSSTVSAPAPVTSTGEKVYVVRKGDNGMWGVSKSQYGDGKYFPAIAGRNPGVNPSRLRVGQKLILPSLEQAKAFLGSSSGGAGRTTSDTPSTPIPVRTPMPIPAPRPVGDNDEPDFS